MQKLGPVKTAMLLVAVLALLVAAGWLGYAFFSRSGPLQTTLVTSVPATTSQSKPQTTASSPPSVNPRALTANVPAATPFSGFGVVTSRTLNLRAEPNTQATIIGSLKFGDIAALVRRDGGWYQTEQGAWISALFLEIRQTRPEAESYARELKTATGN